MVLLSVLAVVLVLVVVALTWQEVRGMRREAAIQSILAAFGPAQIAAQQDPRQLLVWQPLAVSYRTLFPAAFQAIDDAVGSPFPYSNEVIERAHARWTTEWLAWEKAHDEEYRIKASEAELEIGLASGEAAALARARLGRIQHEKIERYQHRYEEYVRTAKALHVLLKA